MSLRVGVGQRRLVFQDGLGLAGYGPLAGTGVHDESHATTTATLERTRSELAALVAAPNDDADPAELTRRASHRANLERDIRTAEKRLPALRARFLMARVMRIEPEGGAGPIFLGFVDLWTGSAEVHRSVVDALGIAPHQFLMIGSHTHSAPGHFAGNRLYDAFAQSPGGFDASVAEVISDALVGAARAAGDDVQPARVVVIRGEASFIGRNRSLGAFLQNFPNHADWVSQWREALGVADLPGDAYEQAVDPRLWSVWAFAKEADHLLGTFITVACHNAALGRDCEIYHPDWAGLATHQLAELTRDAWGEREPWAALAQGAAGDVTAIPSGQTMSSLGEALAKVRAEQVAQAWHKCLVKAREALAGQAITTLEVGFTRWRPKEDGLDSWCIGQAVINGSDESRSPWFLERSGEARRSSLPWDTIGKLLAVRHDHAPKQPAFGILEPAVRRLFTDLEPAPEHPLHLLRLGDHVFFVLPCEITGVAAHQVERALLERFALLGKSGLSASPIAVTNDYCGYLTTEAEYEAQNYEGAHNLFGRRSLEAVTRRLVGLVHPPGALEIDKSPPLPVGDKDRLPREDFEERIMKILRVTSAPLRIGAVLGDKVRDIWRKSTGRS